MIVLAEDKVSCAVCDREFTPAYSVIGVSAWVSAGPEHAEEIDAQIAPYKRDKKYNICYPCWLGALGVKP